MFATMLLTTALLTSAITSRAYEEPALVRYRAAISEYAQLHREAAAALPEGAMCAGPEQLELLRKELADEIRRARPGAREGDIFTRDVADLLRTRLARALTDDEGDVDDLFASVPDEPADRPAPLEVNAVFPREAGPPRWRTLFWALPSLPEELEYRVAGRDLVLLDVDTRVVVDILRNAVQ